MLITPSPFESAVLKKPSNSSSLNLIKVDPDYFNWSMNISLASSLSMVPLLSASNFANMAVAIPLATSFAL